MVHIEVFIFFYCYVKQVLNCSSTSVLGFSKFWTIRERLFQDLVSFVPFQHFCSGF